MVMVEVKCSDGHELKVNEEMFTRLRVVITRDTGGYTIPYSRWVSQVLIHFLENINEPVIANARVKIMTLNSLISLMEAAHKLEIPTLMNVACENLVIKVQRSLIMVKRKKNDDDLMEECAGLGFNRRYKIRRDSMVRSTLSMRTDYFVPDCHHFYVFLGNVPDRNLLLREISDLATEISSCLEFDTDSNCLELGTDNRNFLNSDKGLMLSFLLERLIFYLSENQVKLLLPLLQPTCFELVLNVAQKVLQIHRPPYEAARVLSLLSHEQYVPFKDNTLTRLSQLIMFEFPFHTESALLVIGNVVRWGNIEQVQFLTEHCDLLSRIGAVMPLLDDKCLIEACRIILMVAVQSDILIKDMENGTSVITQLCRILLRNGSSFVKMEAALAISYACFT